MRITINYFEGYPELEAELARHSPRARAERLRFLAAMGLAFMKDGRLKETVAPTSQPIPGHYMVAMGLTPVSETPHQAAESTENSAAKSITRNVFKQVD